MKLAADPVRDETHIVILTTGGTIASRTDADGVRAPAVSGGELVAAVPLPDHVRVEVREIASLDSSAMTPADMDRIRAAVAEALSGDRPDGVVVTHGTDTLEETALLLDMCHDDARPVIVTGSQLPFDDAATDAIDNLQDAILIAADPTSRGLGVLVVFGRAVLCARGVRKWHTTNRLAFATTAPEDDERPAPLVPAPGIAGIRVDVVALYPGADRAAIDAAVAAGARGVILEGMGAGNATASVAAAVREHDDVVFVMTSRVPRGGVDAIYGGVGGGAGLADLGVIGGGWMSPWQARIALAALLASGVDRTTIAAYLGS